MATHGPTPLPPTTIHSTTPISASAAHDFLSAYLDRATADPALQPDACITEHGPTSRTTASAPNLALHNLKRVLAGLGGEVLGRDLMIGEDGNLRVDSGENSGEIGTENDGAEGNEGWEDAEQYEQEQWQGQSEDGQEQSQDGHEQSHDEQGDPMQIDDATIEKEERKRRKKERRLAEKRAKSSAAEP